MKMYSFREMCLFLLQVTALKCLAGVLTFNNSELLLITKQHNERVPHSSEQRTLPKEAEHSVHPIHKYLGRLLLSYQQHLLCQEHKPTFTTHTGQFSFCEHVHEIRRLVENISFCSIFLFSSADWQMNR